jgi:hypothetical protein
MIVGIPGATSPAVLHAKIETPRTAAATVKDSFLRIPYQSPLRGRSFFGSLLQERLLFICQLAGNLNLYTDIQVAFDLWSFQL